MYIYVHVLICCLYRWFHLFHIHTHFKHIIVYILFNIPVLTMFHAGLGGPKVCVCTNTGHPNKIHIFNKHWPQKKIRNISPTCTFRIGKQINMFSSRCLAKKTPEELTETLREDLKVTLKGRLKGGFKVFKEKAFLQQETLGPNGNGVKNSLISQENKPH